MTPSFTVGHKAYVEDGTDAHGNPVDTWAAPVDLKVYGIAPTTSTEPDPSRPLVITGLALYAPPDTTADPRDHFVIDGVEYEVIGEIGDWTKGPFGWAAGVEIVVKRWEG